MWLKKSSKKQNRATQHKKIQKQKQKQKQNKTKQNKNKNKKQNKTKKEHTKEISKYRPMPLKTLFEYNSLIKMCSCKSKNVKTK